MKSNILLVALAAGLLLTSYSFGQSTPEPSSDRSVESSDTRMSTLFSGKGTGKNQLNYLGLSITPEFQYSRLAGQFTPMAGVAGMVHFNKRFALGAAAYTTLNDRFSPTSLSGNRALEMDTWYGGLRMEFTPKPDAKVHVSFPLLIGMGEVDVDSVNHREWRDREDYRDDYLDYNETKYFVIQPGVNLEVNLIRYVKFTLGASYRIVPAVGNNNSALVRAAYPTPSASQLGGLNLSAGLRIGLFDYPLHHRPKAKRTK